MIILTLAILMATGLYALYTEDIFLFDLIKIVAMCLIVYELNCIAQTFRKK